MIFLTRAEARERAENGRHAKQQRADDYEFECKDLGTVLYPQIVEDKIKLIYTNYKVGRTYNTTKTVEESNKMFTKAIMMNAKTLCNTLKIDADEYAKFPYKIPNFRNSSYYGELREEHDLASFSINALKDVEVFKKSVLITVDNMLNILGNYLSYYYSDEFDDTLCIWEEIPTETILEINELYSELEGLREKILDCTLDLNKLFKLNNKKVLLSNEKGIGPN